MYPECRRVQSTSSKRSLLELSERKLSTGGEPTPSPLRHLFCRDSKHRQHFGHDFSHHLRHLWLWWNFGIGLEACKEVFYPVEEPDKHITARCGVPCRLWAMLSRSSQYVRETKDGSLQGEYSRKDGFGRGEQLALKVRHRPVIK